MPDLEHLVDLVAERLDSKVEIKHCTHHWTCNNRKAKYHWTKVEQNAVTFK